MPETIDADAHVVEGAAFASVAMERWPDRVRLERTPEGTPVFVIDGRRYPEASGPGAGWTNCVRTTHRSRSRPRTERRASNSTM